MVSLPRCFQQTDPIVQRTEQGPSKPHTIMKIIYLFDNIKCYVDDKDYKYLIQFNWKIMGGAVVRNVWINGKSVFIPIGYEVLIRNGVKNIKEVDHINGNIFDNQFSNLRSATHAQNQMNKGLSTRNNSGFKGVSYNLKHQKYYATIRINKKSLYLGYFTKPEDAAIIYDRAARRYFKEFARLNFPKENEQSV